MGTGCPGGLRDPGTGVARLLAACALACLLAAGAQAAGRRGGEAWIRVPMPAGFRVEPSEFDGPVFADARGRTLYRWPFKGMRNGVTGDAKGESNCGDEKATVSGGLMSPYPGGLELPELATRPSCTQVWPPALAAEGAVAVGKWSIITRRDGRRQWAYDGAALYTSVLDQRPGDVLGGDSFSHQGDNPAVREPVRPPPDVPPGFAVTTTYLGRMLQTERGFGVYVSTRDRRGRSLCEGECAHTWPPMAAPGSARPHGDWSIVERSDGGRQWAFRGKPLYRYALDPAPRRVLGSDEPGWELVYTQRTPAPPAEFTVQDTSAGQVLADGAGRTLYSYTCGDDAFDQLGCDHPDEPQVYRLVLCGGGSAERCLRNFPYVPAPKGARDSGRLWRVMLIDPLSGRRAEPGAAGALRVWAFRDRPVYTFAGDDGPGEVNADAWGEFRAERQGYKAFWLRDDFFRGPG